MGFMREAWGSTKEETLTNDKGNVTLD